MMTQLAPKTRDLLIARYIIAGLKEHHLEEMAHDECGLSHIA
jgi:hypothetical protein